MTWPDSREVGDTCTRCGLPLTRREMSFFWRGTYYPGAYCVTCNSLWALKGEEMPPLRPAAWEQDR